MLLKSNEFITNENRLSLQKQLSLEWDTKVCILPYGLEIVEPQGYLIWDRDKYVNYRLQEGPICSRKDILKEWEKLSKGYRFVIAVYQEDIRSYMIYSVPFFAEKVMCDG